VKRVFRYHVLEVRGLTEINKDVFLDSTAVTYQSGG
jgi:hypothetical protein